MTHLTNSPHLADTRNCTMGEIAPPTESNVELIPGFLIGKLIDLVVRQPDQYEKFATSQDPRDRLLAALMSVRLHHAYPDTTMPLLMALTHDEVPTVAITAQSAIEVASFPSEPPR